ncbi:MAG: hypothetical protein O3C57_01275 [Verrucomicrobia bacterium]|nr:hypothetical protein [Verrucomicrobiota bacterium]
MPDMRTALQGGYADAYKDTIDPRYAGMTHTGQEPVGMDTVRAFQAMPGQIADWARANPMEAALTAASMAPWPVGDAAGIGADVMHYWNYPEDITPTNVGISAAGAALPFVPGFAAMAGMVRGVKGSTSDALTDLPMDEAGRMASNFGRGADAVGVVPKQMDDYANVTQTMTPERFLSLAPPLETPDRNSVDFFNSILRGEVDKKLANPWLNVEWDDVNSRWAVSSHEGRNRMTAAKEQGITEVPTQIFLKNEVGNKIPLKSLDDPTEMRYAGITEEKAARMKNALKGLFMNQSRTGLAGIAGASVLTPAMIDAFLADKEGQY